MITCYKKRGLKKWVAYLRMLVFVAILCAFYSTLSVKADTVTPIDNNDWIHSAFTVECDSTDNPLNKYKSNNNNSIIYYNYVNNGDDTNSVVIRYDSGSSYTDYIFTLDNELEFKYVSPYSGVSTYTKRSFSSNTHDVIDYDLITYFPELANNVYYFTGSSNTKSAYTWDIEHYDYLCTSSLDLYNQVMEDIENGNGSNYDGLPFLAYSLSRKIVPTYNLSVNTTKMILSWDYSEKEPYLSNPYDYTFDIFAYANFKTDQLGATVWDDENMNPTSAFYRATQLTQGGQNISINEFSWLYKEVGQSIYEKANINFRPPRQGYDNSKIGYYIAIRTRSNDNTQHSYWKVFKCNDNGVLTSTGKCIDDNRLIIDAPSGVDNSNDNMSNTSPNGGGVAGFSYDNSTTAQSDPTSTVYGTEEGHGNDISISNVVGTLKGLINQLGFFPYMITQMLGFMPAWMTELMVASIALLVVIGIVKLVIN